MARSDGATTNGLYDRLQVTGGAATGHARFLAIDMLRALAALMVLASHGGSLGFAGGTDPEGLRWSTAAAISGLSAGVYVFFAVSGFLIGGPFLHALLAGGRPPATARYALRRAVRIAPAYWVALAVAIVLAGTAGKLWQLGIHVALLHDLVPGEQHRYLGVAWTLAVEVIFYAFVPLAALAAWRLAGRRPLGLDVLALGVIALWVASTLWGVVTAAIWPLGPGAHPSDAVLLIRGTLPSWLFHFCPGLLIFLAETSAARERGGWWARYRAAKQRPLLLLLAAGAIWVLHVWMTLDTATAGPYAEVARQLNAVAVGLILMAGLATAEWLRPIVRVLAPVGLISYGVYLWHGVAFEAMKREGFRLADGAGPLAWPLNGVLLLAIALPLGLASWLLIERPLLRRTTFWERRGAPMSEAAAPAPLAAHAPAEV